MLKLTTITLLCKFIYFWYISRLAFIYIFLNDKLSLIKYQLCRYVGLGAYNVEKYLAAILVPYKICINLPVLVCLFVNFSKKPSSGLTLTLTSLNCYISSHWEETPRQPGVVVSVSILLVKTLYKLLHSYHDITYYLNI